MTGSPNDRLQQLVYGFPEPQLAQAFRWLQQTDTPCYLVGGTVRDCLLATTSRFAPARATLHAAGCSAPLSTHHDLDFAVPSGARQLARQLADELGAAYYPLDDTRDVGRVVVKAGESGARYVIDIARFQGDSLEADLRARDFTLNAMALDIHSQPPRLLDPCGGQSDLRVGLLRATGDTAVLEDPVRALRAVRLRAQFGFEIETHTRTLITRAVLGLRSVSAERVRDEVNKTLCLADVTDSLYEMDSLGLLCVVFPELLEEKGLSFLSCHQWDVFSHSLETVSTLEQMLPINAEPDEAEVPFPELVAHYLSESVSGEVDRRTLLTWAALFHELGQPYAKNKTPRQQPDHIHPSPKGTDDHAWHSAKLAAAILTRLHFSRQAIRLVDSTLRNHTLPLHLATRGSVDRRAAYRFFRDTDNAGVEAVLLALADNRAIIGPGSHTREWPALLAQATFLLDAYFHHKESVVSPPPLLTGDDIVNQFGVKPGPQLGQLLADLSEDQAAGEVQDLPQALTWLDRRLTA